MKNSSIRILTNNSNGNNNIMAGAKMFYFRLQSIAHTTKKYVRTHCYWNRGCFLVFLNFSFSVVFLIFFIFHKAHCCAIHHKKCAYARALLLILNLNILCAFIYVYMCVCISICIYNNNNISHIDGKLCFWHGPIRNLCSTKAREKIHIHYYRYICGCAFQKPLLAFLFCSGALSIAQKPLN